MVDPVKPFLNGKFWSFFEASGLAAVVIVNGYLKVSTSSFRELFGYNDVELEGMHCRQITHPHDVDTDEKMYQLVMDGRRNTYTLEKRYLPKFTEPFDALLTAVALRDDSTGELVGTVNIIKPLKQSIDSPITSSINPDAMEAAAKRIVDYTGEIEVKASQMRGLVSVGDDKRPFLTRLGDWVLKLVDKIKGLSFAQCLLVGFLAALTLAGYLAVMYLGQILEQIK